MQVQLHLCLQVLMGAFKPVLQEQAAVQAAGPQC